MKLVRRFLIEGDNEDKWIENSELTKDSKIIRTQVHFLPEDHNVFQSNESDEQKEYLIFNYDDEHHWHERLRDDFVPKE